MRHSMQKVVSWGCVSLGLFAVIAFTASPGPAQTEPAAEADPGPEPAPPSGQTFIGNKKCAACHFDQYMVWKGDKHAKAFDVLPAKYKTDASCLICHTTGYGKETGYKTTADAHLAGITCEVCHGPGSKHEEICKPFANIKKLTKEDEKSARDSIYNTLPKNVCVTCHLAKAHKKHPKYDK